MAKTLKAKVQEAPTQEQPQPTRDETIAALEEEIKRLKGLLRRHTGRDDYQ